MIALPLKNILLISTNSGLEWSTPLTMPDSFLHTTSTAQLVPRSLKVLSPTVVGFVLKDTATNNIEGYLYNRLTTVLTKVFSMSARKDFNDQLMDQHQHAHT